MKNKEDKEDKILTIFTCILAGIAIVFSLLVIVVSIFKVLI